MAIAGFEERRRLERLDTDELHKHQLVKLNKLLTSILPQNRFYSEKLADLSLPLSDLDSLREMPFTLKEELHRSDPGNDFAANLTFPVKHYTRFHRTSGTRGRPFVVLDTAEDWAWWIRLWQFVLDTAGLSPEDRVFLAFSFGPFIGFWSAHDAATFRGCLAVPGGGMSTLARLELMRSSRVTVLFCTPSYALHLAEVGNDHQLDVASLDIRRIIVAGEPGGSVSNIRQRIEALWDAELIDHGGATEVGPWGYSDNARSGLHVNEAEFIAEFLSVETGQHALDGELSELVLTTLGRTGSPVLRYRTGDLVRPRWSSTGGCRFVLLEEGILGRADDMMIIRGVNVFPSSVEQILHSFSEIAEYRMTAHRSGEMDSLSVEIEDRLELPDRVAKELQLRLGLKVDVRCVPIGSLPRFESKGKRFLDER
ncbi:MAG: CoF synthetase [Planctomycetaceae bacterium]|nr:CoF synthetase [Planctomycetaceae bacterium]MBP60342.1 CoF synthetase [Planctomycetaceae bacterium]